MNPRRYDPQKYAAKPEQVELYMSCKNLRNLDALSKSDPQLRLYTKENGKWKLFGKTETRKDNLNPIFRVTFTLDFVFEMPSYLKFEVVDVDGPDNVETIGAAETTLSAIMGARNQTLNLDLTLKATRNCGKLTIKGEKFVEYRNILLMEWAGVKLLNTDGPRDQSDPFLRFYKKRSTGEWLQVHQTEVIMNTLNPRWKPFDIGDTKLASNHRDIIRVECWDFEKSGNYQFIGDCEITINQLKAGEEIFELQNPKVRSKPGHIRLVDFTIRDPSRSGSPRADERVPEPEKPNQDQTADFNLKDLILNQSEYVPKPKPQPIEKPNQQDQNQNQGDFSLKDLVLDQSQYIPKPKPKPPSNQQEPIQKPVPQKVLKPTFIDYLRSGTTLNTVVAIDFSSSNGPLSSPDSLHAIYQDGSMNEYQKAIYCVCQILLNYDYDQQSAMLGFGAKPNYPQMKSKTVADCFPLTGNFEQQQAQGLQGVIDIYNYALQNVELSGPPRFAPIIKETMGVCEANKKANNDVYTILLLVTSGKVSDMEETKDLIVKAAALPLSVIIVGVGNGDFTDMEILDGDKGLFNAKGEKAKRDLVQFVPFREFNDMNSLAQCVLQEVPDQLVEYMLMIGKMPIGFTGGMM